MEQLEKNGHLTLERVKKEITDIVHGLSPEHDARPIVQLYTGHLNTSSNSEQLKLAVYDAYGDYHIACPLIFYSETLAHQLIRKSSVALIYAFEFMQPLHANGCTKNSGQVCHGVEQYHLFGRPIEAHTRNQTHYTLQDYQLSLSMIQAWTKFARTGQMSKVPFGPHQVEWSQAYEPSLMNSIASGHDDVQANLEHFQYLQINPKGGYKMASGLLTARCHVWRKILFEDLFSG